MRVMVSNKITSDLISIFKTLQKTSSFPCKSKIAHGSQKFSTLVMSQNKSTPNKSKKHSKLPKGARTSGSQNGRSSTSNNDRGDGAYNSGSAIPVIQGNRPRAKQESIVNARQQVLLQNSQNCHLTNLVDTSDARSNSHYQEQPGTQQLVYYSHLVNCHDRQYREPIFFNQFCNPHLLSNYTGFTNTRFSQRYLYNKYFHRAESNNRNQPNASHQRATVKLSDDQSGYVESLRSWENVGRFKCQKKCGTHITLMCYNVLAQDLIGLHPNIYKYHNPNALKWDVRWNNILSEIQQFEPDILCMQEVQESHIKDYYSALESLGYGVIYKKRTGFRIDGCAIYYKKEKLNLVDSVTVEYFQSNVNVLNRDNVGVIARFCPKNSNSEFVVSTTHLLYNPRRQDVRLAQIQLLFSELDRIAYDRSGNSYDSYVPMIITGDLNSKPDTALVKFINKGKLIYERLSARSLAQSDCGPQTGKILIPSHLNITDNCQHAALLKQRRKYNEMSRTDELNFVGLQHSERPLDGEIRCATDPCLFSTGTLQHPFSLKSVYQHMNNNDIEGTTYQEEWITVDYIFYSGKKDYTFEEDKLKLLSRYRLPTSSELTNIKIPNGSVGSDHLSLIARFFLEN